jgi:putative transposase
VRDLIAAGLSIRDGLAWVGYPKSSWYRHQGAPPVGRARIRQADRAQPQALAEAETAQILAWLSEERFADCSVQQTFWRVIDEGCYVASLRTWYRVAARHRLCGDRRRQCAHPATVIPQLCAGGPNQVWSWDITRVKIKVQKTPLHLYLIEDVFSRKCVGWRLEQRERDRLAADLIQTAVGSEGATPHTLHADGGPSMTSQEVAVLLRRLGIDRSRSRPHVSNDNPFSESLFKTLKYDLDYPVVFDDYDHARAWIEVFLARYNAEHRHSGLAGFTPNSVHDGTWTVTAANRQALLDAHYQTKPGRYRRPPLVKTPPGTVWINQPKAA